MQPNVGKIFHENTKGREQVSTFHLPVLASMTEGWQRKDTHGCHELVSNGSGVRKTAFLSQQGLGYLESKQPGHSKISHVSNNEPKILWKKPSTTLRHTYVDLMSTYRFLFTLWVDPSYSVPVSPGGLLLRLWDQALHTTSEAAVA